MDTASRRIVARRSLGGHYVQAATAGRRLVLLLLDSFDEPQAAWLDVVDANGDIRRVALEGFSLGFSTALAVDSDQNRAFVIDRHLRVAMIDLATLSIQYRQIQGSPPVNGSDFSSERKARYLGNDLLAFVGRDADSSEPDRPAGLALINTEKWTMQIVDPTATEFRTGRRLLLTYGYWNSGVVVHGAGISGYTVEGARRFHILAQKGICCLRAIGPYAYLYVYSGQRLRPAIVRIDTGRIVLRPASLPVLLDPRENAFR